MNTVRLFKILTALCVWAGLFTLPSVSLADSNQATSSIRLGKITVQGQQNIVQVLEDIKVALRQPYSTDPRLANVVVCRFVPQAGSHIMEHLICGTNRALSRQRFALQTAMLVAESGQPGCNVSCVMEHIFTQLNEYLQNQSTPSFQTVVNGSALRTVLEKLPDPNSAAEIMTLGTVTIHGQANIMRTLQAIKLGLQQPRSDDPKLANVVVCRFNTLGSSTTDQMLYCATNATLSKQAAIAPSAHAIATPIFSANEAAKTQITALNSILANTPGNALQAKVDGPALQALLKEISYSFPASPATPAPSSAKGY